MALSTLPPLKPCTCSVKFNLPMLLPFNESLDEFKVECDNCGNETRYVGDEEHAVMLWNEFQHKKGKPRKQKGE